MDSRRSRNLLSMALTAVSWGCLLGSTSGCAAFKATQQPNKKDLTVLSPGTPRSHVIAELGTAAVQRAA